MRALTILSSGVLFVAVVLSVLQDSVFTDWRAIQSTYADFLLETAQTEADRELAVSFPIELRQVYLPALGRVDRCVTCHVGVDNPRAANLPWPLRTHPGDYLLDHDVERFGCTICHDGQGRATVPEEAMAREPSLHFERPALGPPFIQARCYRCHTGRLKDTPIYNRGRELFTTRGCGGCHRIDGDGGVAGPALDGLSDASPTMKHPSPAHADEVLARTDGNLNLAYIYESIKYPDAQPIESRSLMIAQELTDDDVLALTVYLKGLERDDPAGRYYAPEDGVERGAREGRATFARYCSGCHGASGEGGRDNPNAVAEQIPTLEALNEKLMLFERADAEVFIARVLENDGAPPSPGEVGIPRAAVAVASYRSILDVIRNGNPSGRKDPDGPVPLDMPPWKSVLSDTEIAQVIAHIIQLGEFDDDVDPEEEEEEEERVELGGESSP